MRNHGVEAAGWEANLEKYVSTLKEYDYMVQRARESRDPFFATGEYLIDNLVLKRCLPPELLSQPLRKVNSVWEWETEGAKQLTIVGTRGANLSKTWVFNFRRRAVIAAVGGMFLVGPMWLMVLRSELITQLVATTVFVTGFGLLMAAFLDKDEAVLASTAAYAAVLVVFVGTSIGNDSGGVTR
ncbi:hypothetical protein N656DRAFT_836261 [Canariomyces notabilis]|uniref:DUF6594 domain-containing protein n=1 Tax=Canariomyces notabilis TaxID=2074819 RepID=A0AAN6TGD4_9PEZI|nr:hypothetical protein N656DRAFT_836261 [Canariomyces arenarius]